MKKNQKTGVLFPLMSLLMTFGSVIGITIGSFGNFSEGIRKMWIIIGIGFAGGLIVFLAGFVIMTFSSRLPATVTMAVLGFPQVGKTVYITILQNLMLLEKRKQNYEPYGAETLERVTMDMSMLKSRKWLPPTPKEGVFFYRSLVTCGRKNYKLEIGDYAGERFQYELDKSEAFLHKTEYYKYVADCDIVFLAMDTAHIISEFDGEQTGGLPNSEFIQNSMITALQLMQQEKQFDHKGVINFPVALLYLKTDRLAVHSVSRERILKKCDTIIKYCQKHCKNFNIFWVASLTPEAFDDDMPPPPSKFKPENVMEAVDWAIQRVRRFI